ncbi:acetyl-CoA carboxylase carboxyl transferase subunit alpha [Macrococcoides bohemicum]|uniref:Acetyl-coenzyme A carboxylase carboxyl transferase subunit alpha n=1 Tax=Macrococcoides bohemicum TaxID=1903056 RepID=A0A4R5YA73_9STAP|nr:MULTISPECIES: acetyl-CoA carboxylase carboxyl transferase subunit alpha [Macrococcus]ATD30019.1 acetyl-CoA carboxylase carboxyltransferase subunit alpha [Macrococcus sp. IME1552]MBC9873732.1 acetyl-CoA carboxylase carboxyl transferase subunit alpha [Macrococcus bohemicus]QRN50279.1 acetyl-CoA carboxylase carboxyl transferase subunit alpha [Macrococcus bohemicus]QYA41697.1 acetyl-CoA carboxylase carboxyl transferase subunit alpha [Macrococcus bohemicus]QYA44126.1 acetyl-CoA carboxylase carbo
MALEFEKPLIELDRKIEELKKYMASEGVDLSDEVKTLQISREEKFNEIYDNLTPWQRVQIARLTERPTTLDYIHYLFEDFIELHGDRNFRDDPAIIGGVARYKGKPVTVIGHQRGKDTKDNIYRNFGMAHPEGYRKALRLMKQADKFNRPIILFIDTKGAYPGKAAEERGQSESIARNLVEMAGLSVPVISIVIGEGGSGGALGLGICNRLLMLENSTYSVISPEGAAALLWKDSSLAQLAAESMRITGPDLLELNIVDELITEVKGGAHLNIAAQSEHIDISIEKHLNELMQLDKQALKNQRYDKFRKIGSAM